LEIETHTTVKRKHFNYYVFVLHFFSVKRIRHIHYNSSKTMINLNVFSFFKYLAKTGFAQLYFAATLQLLSDISCPLC